MGFLANTIEMPGTAVSQRLPNGEVMSIVILAAAFALTVAQLVFWEGFGDTFGYAASVSIMGFCASITLILAAYVAATYAFRLCKAL